MGYRDRGTVVRSLSVWPFLILTDPRNLFPVPGVIAPHSRAARAPEARFAIPHWRGGFFR